MPISGPKKRIEAHGRNKWKYKIWPKEVGVFIELKQIPYNTYKADSAES
jgi:hypothetical protein